MKGIILAGGSGTRLWPLTRAVNKHLLPIYNKPMIYYPLTTLMLAGIGDVLIITNPDDRIQFERLLGDGNSLGISLQYETQATPLGIADAFRVGSTFIDGDSVCLILGDNFFHGNDLQEMLRSGIKSGCNAKIFAYPVADPERFGIVTLRPDGRPVSIIEKPSSPGSDLAVPGLYFYHNDVVGYAAELCPSERGELEITDLNRTFLKRRELQVEPIGRGVTWLDVGTFEAFLEAGNFVRMLETRQGLRIGCPEEVAWRLGLIDSDRLEELAKEAAGDLGAYLRSISNGHAWER
jgi:glucose-1-phosphate thymidylyltransferase